MKWFKHDSDAHRDAKLKKLRIKHGMTGYGLYWYLLENIANAVDLDNLTFELEEDSEIISHETGIHFEQVEKIMADMVSLDLFENNGGIITCLKLARRLDQSMTSNPKMRHMIEQIRISHDSVMTKSETIMQDKIRLEVDKNKTSCQNSEGVSTRKRVPFIEIQELWNTTMPELPECKKLTKTRESQIRARWNNGLPDLDNWKNFFEYIRQSSFLMGRVDSRRPFRATLDWVTKESNYVKILEGNYHG